MSKENVTVENLGKEEGETKKKVVLTPKKLIRIAAAVGATVAGIAFAKSVNKRQTAMESDISDLSVRNAENTLRLDMLEDAKTSEEIEDTVDLDETELEEF